MRQVLIIPIHGSTPSSWKIAVSPQSERAYARKSSKFLQMLTRLAKADRHEEFCVAELTTTPGNDQRAWKIAAPTSS
jgi:hypothetical protein